MTKSSQSLAHIFAYFDIFVFKEHNFLIKTYFKFLVHILKNFQKSCISVNIFHEPRAKIIIFSYFYIGSHKEDRDSLYLNFELVD